MKTIGLDIGTTTVCGVLVDGKSGKLLCSKTLGNDTVLPGKEPWERCQNPHKILGLCNKIITEFKEENDDIKGIGISCQMHGILYLDESGKAVSPLYTWQDERGNLPYSYGQTYAQYLSNTTGYAMATGYGLTTHFYNVHNRLVPQDAVWICTIGDYVAMSLTGETFPVMHSSNAASLGLFDITNACFDRAALKKANLFIEMLPSVTSYPHEAGITTDGMTVSVAVGDNQAGFFGSVGSRDSVFVNVGTSGQISMTADSVMEAKDTEVRPYFGQSLLAVGCILCGGDAYAQLKNFYEKTACMFGVEAVDVYEKMNKSAADLYEKEKGLAVCTQFRGTRQNAALRGGITGIGTDNFTPAHLTLGVLNGICQELYQLYLSMPRKGEAHLLVGSGNGIRKNALLQRIFSNTFGLALKIPLYEEEAAYGMALLSLYVTGTYKTLEEVQQLIQYQ